MNSFQKLPRDLAIIAGIFLLFGLSASIRSFLLLFHQHISLNIAILQFFIGWGLLRLHPLARYGALAFVWLSLVGLPMLTILLVITDPTMRGFGEPLALSGRLVLAGIFIVLFLLHLWQYHILNRPPIRELFGVTPSASPKAHSGFSLFGSVFLISLILYIALPTLWKAVNVQFVVRVTGTSGELFEGNCSYEVAGIWQRRRSLNLNGVSINKTVTFSKMITSNASPYELSVMGTAIICSVDARTAPTLKLEILQDGVVVKTQQPNHLALINAFYRVPSE